MFSHPLATARRGLLMSDPIELLSLNHLSFEVKRLGASVAFYRDILGFVEMPRPDLGFAGAWIRNGAACIHLIEKPSLPEPGPTIDPRGNHTAFEVKSAAEVKARLDAAGIPYRANELRGTPITQVFFRDPDGYQIEVADYSVGK
jgi:catechol 2,3-dioxygenase-like lactoylglutathione lyase family enzyme